LPVGIVGDRGSGKSVFVSLLATTATSYTNAKPDEFRYFTSPAFTRKVGDIMSSLKMGTWPSATLKGTLSQYKFSFGFKRRFSELEKLGRKPFDVMTFSIYDISGEDVQIIKQISKSLTQTGSDLNLVEDLPENLRTILDCHVLVFLIDGSKITTEARSKRYQDMLDYDTVMATLISLVGTYKSMKAKQLKTEAKLYPAFVITKFDLIDTKILLAIGLSPQYAAVAAKGGHGLTSLFRENESRERAEYGTTLMDKFFGHTLALIRGAKLINVDFDKARFFFSHVRTELSEDGLPIPTLKTEGVSHELNYSDSEYMEFIRYLGTVAKKSPDKSEDVQAGDVAGLGG
jgi:hypothetical protein